MHQTQTHLPNPQPVKDQKNVLEWKRQSLENRIDQAERLSQNGLFKATQASGVNVLLDALNDELAEVIREQARQKKAISAFSRL